ncbi:hypothetical protein SLEP1_g60363, partial [Rubroshorea leprosula]
MDEETYSYWRWRSKWEVMVNDDDGGDGDDANGVVTGWRQADLEMDFRRWSEMDEETYSYWRWISKREVMVNDDDGGDGDDANG